MQKIRVLIAHGDTGFLEELRGIFRRHADVQVVGRTGAGQEALTLAEELQPDVLLLDVSLFKGLGFEIVPRIGARTSKTKVIVVSSYYADELAAEALYHGAMGYLLKTAARDELIKAVRAAHRGEVWAGRRVLTKALERLREKGSGASDFLSDLGEELTGREVEVIKWAALGKTNKEMASALGISPETVRTHLRNIFRKLRVRRKSELILQVLRRYDLK